MTWVDLTKKRCPGCSGPLESNKSLLFFKLVCPSCGFKISGPELLAVFNRIFWKPSMRKVEAQWSDVVPEYKEDE